MEYFLAKRGGKVKVLVGTSGDTGSACMEACRGKKHVECFVLFPGHGRISEIQGMHGMCECELNR